VWPEKRARRSSFFPLEMKRNSRFLPEIWEVEAVAFDDYFFSGSGREKPFFKFSFLLPRLPRLLPSTLFFISLFRWAGRGIVFFPFFTSKGVLPTEPLLPCATKYTGGAFLFFPRKKKGLSPLLFLYLLTKVGFYLLLAVGESLSPQAGSFGCRS